MPGHDQLTALDAAFLELEQADDGALIHTGNDVAMQAKRRRLRTTAPHPLHPADAGAMPDGTAIPSTRGGAIPTPVVRSGEWW